MTLRYYIFETQISEPSRQILWTHQNLPKVGIPQKNFIFTNSQNQAFWESYAIAHFSLTTQNLALIKSVYSQPSLPVSIFKLECRSWQLTTILHVTPLLFTCHEILRYWLEGVAISLWNGISSFFFPLRWWWNVPSIDGMFLASWSPPFALCTYTGHNNFHLAVELADC